MNFRVKYRTTRSKFENLSRSTALTQFVKYISDETPQNHSKIAPKHPKALENYGTTRQKTLQTPKTKYFELISLPNNNIFQFENICK